MNNPEPQPQTTDRTERWLQEKFHCAGAAYVEQMPASLSTRQLMAAAAPVKSLLLPTRRARLTPVTFAWAGACAALFIAGGLVWRQQLQHRRTEAAKQALATASVTPKPAAPVVARLTVPTAAKRLPPLTTTVTQPAAPALNPETAAHQQQAANNGAIVTAQPQVFQAGAGVRIPTGPVTMPPPLSQPRTIDGRQPGRLPGVVATGSGTNGPVVATLPLTPTSGSGFGSGTVQMTATVPSSTVAATTPTQTATVTVQPTVDGLTLQATDLTPNTEYAVQVLLRGATEPVTILVHTSDADGALNLTVSSAALSTAILPPGSGGVIVVSTTPLPLSDIQSVLVEDVAKKEVVLQTPVTAPQN